MTERTAAQFPTPVQRAPLHVRLGGKFLSYFMAAGIPILFNKLVTIRGRNSGLPRTAGLAVIEFAGRRWMWAPWGDVNWVRNLRAAGRATITLGRRKPEEVRATELDSAQRVVFFRDVLGPLARSKPFGVLFIRLVDGVDLNDPVEAAQGRVVFEIQPLPDPLTAISGSEPGRSPTTMRP
jgi:deazaflavin-dependent oxidoreductase (nitroreductase family)